MLGPAEQLNNTYFFSTSVYKMDKIKLPHVMKYGNLVYSHVRTILCTYLLLLVYSHNVQLEDFNIITS